jgi:acyl-CoA thioesterase
MAHTPAHQMFDRDAASKGLGIELLEAGNGQATTRMRVTAEMVNGHGMTHGVTVTCDGDVVAEFRGRSRQIS